MPVDADHDLGVIAEAWLTLPLAMREGILAMVTAAAAK